MNNKGGPASFEAVGHKSRNKKSCTPMSDIISRGALKHLISTDAAWMWQGL